MRFKPWQDTWLKSTVLGLLTLGVIFMINQVFPELLGRFFGAFFAIFTPFAVAIFIRYLVAPLDRLLIQLNLKEKTARSIVIIAFIFVVIVIFLISAGNQIYTQAILFVENDWPLILTTLEQNLETNQGLSAAYEWLLPYLNFESLSSISVNVFGALQSITSIVLTTVLTPVFLFFLLRDGRKITDALIQLLPKKWSSDIHQLTTRADTVTKQYFNGRFISIAIMSVIFVLIFFLLGFGARSLLFGFLLGILDIIPYIGPVIGTLLPVLYTLTDETIAFGDFAPLAVVIIVVVVNFFQSNALQPYLMGRETKMHPLLVLSSLIFFGYLFGVIGIILAIPLTGTIKTSLEYYREKPPVKGPKNA